MARKITFRRVKLQQEKRKFEFTWDKILLLVLLGALILFYSLTTIFNDEIDSIGRAISEQTEQEQETESIATIRAVIEVENASHLDSGKTFIADITNEVKKLDGIWSEEISDGEYIKVTFEQLLTSNHDITIYPRIVSGSPKIEVYETGGTEIIAEFTSINSNQYNKIFLDGSSGAGLGDRIQDTFDLRVVGGSIEVEHIIDPETWYARSDSSGLSNCITLNNAFSQTAGGTATSIAMGTANEPSCWYTPARSATIDTGIWEAFVEFTTTGTGQGSPASFTVDITFSNGTIKESIASCTTGNNPTGELNCTVSGVPQKTLSNDRIRLSVQKDAGARTINVHYNGSAGGSSDTRIIFPNAVVTDAESPKWQNNQTNSTEAGEPVEHSVNWTDDTALSGYIFEFDNGNGSFFNDSFVTFT
ncbi:MAG: hypothetical protein Q8P79_01680, partial [Nanoarchaeota archaeon]|nr:hypothetical protein [Nanoarchaeota archaeon]